MDAFSFTLVIDCCAPPTLITEPTIDPAFYQYYIGQALPLDISLGGVYTSDSICCGNIDPKAPTIKEITTMVDAPVELFTKIDATTMQVNWADQTSQDIVGIFRLMFEPDHPNMSCINAPAPVAYEV